MKPDKYIEGLLRKWGHKWFSEDLDYPHYCKYLKDYRAKGYREEAQDLDLPEVERLAEFMPLNLSPVKIHVLRIRYRQKIRNKRKAARLLGLTEQNYRKYLNSAIRIISDRF